MPRTWWSSATVNATSALSRSVDVHVATDGDDAVAEFGDDRDPMAVVEVEESCEVGLGSRSPARHEAEVATLVGQAIDELEQLGTVVGGQGPQMQHPAVGDDDIGAPELGLGEGLVGGHEDDLLAGRRTRTSLSGSGVEHTTRGSTPRQSERRRHEPCPDVAATGRAKR